MLALPVLKPLLIQPFVPCLLLLLGRLLSARHDLLEADRDYMVLVMMYPTREEDGSLTRILHTLKEEEKPMEVSSPCWWAEEERS